MDNIFVKNIINLYRSNLSYKTHIWVLYDLLPAQEQKLLAHAVHKTEGLNLTILNISETATGLFDINNTHLEFTARFNKVEHKLYIPIEAVMSVYFNETACATSFQLSEETIKKLNGEDTPPPRKKPNLRLVN